jgi:hypothetical protein
MNAPNPRRSRLLIILVSAAVALVAIAGYVLWGTGTPPATDPASDPAQADWIPGGPPPPEAADTVGRLSSADPAERRSALAPDLDSIVAEINPLPDQATLVLDPQGWRGDDAFAAATATLTVPGQPGSRIMIGFERVDGAWLVTFEEPL